MLLRRSLPVVAALAAAACAKGVPVETPPSSLGYAMFDVSAATPVIPLPNDLGLQASSIAKFPASAFRDMLQSFADSGGYPNDQEVAVTIPFSKVNIDAATGATTKEAPDLDPASITPSSIVILKGATPVTYAPVDLAKDYVKDAGTGIGTLTLHNLRVAKPTATPPVTELKGVPWDAGATYIVAVRGGPSGVKFTGGQIVNPQFTFALLLGGKPLNDPANQSIIPGTAAEKAAAGAQLEVLRSLYATPFAAVDGQFPHTELAVLGTFKIAPLPAGPQVVTDTGARGIVPLPIDLMLAGPASKPDGTLNLNQHVQNLASLGALAPGIASLDGFSTTAMALASVSGPILADTVNKDSVFLYDMTDVQHPVRVKELSEGGSFVAEPCSIAAQVSMTTGATVASGCAAAVPGAVKVSTAIGLQPAIPVQTATAAYFLPPLKERTTYGVIITKKVKGLASVPVSLSRSTLANILLFVPEHKVATDDGKSLISGLPDASAVLVEGMRRLLHPLVAQAITDTKIASRDDIAVAYTFRTQSVTGKYALADAAAPKGLIHFAALPYQAEQQAVAAGGSLYNPKYDPAVTSDPTTGVYTKEEAWQKWGLDAATTPNDAINEVIQAQITTQNLLDPATGAFNPTGATVTEKIKILLVTPQPANVAACPAAVSATHKCGKLIVWHHGLGGSKASVLAVANEYAKQGYFVVAYDGAKHGDRSWCSVTPSPTINAQQCGGGTCDAIAGAGGQGDQYPPGLCHNGNYTKTPTNCTSAACMVAWATWTGAHPTNPGDGNVAISANYLVAANFFRLRDTLRQDVIDASGVILSLSRPPAPFPAIPGTTATGGLSAVGAHLYAQGLLINGFAAAGGGVHWVGQSFGAIQGTLSLAANPRLTKGVLNVGGGTLVDIFTNSPSFAPQVTALLAGLGIAPGTADYLKFINVAKWIVDPAEPLNVAGNILGGTKPTLPDLIFSLSGAPQADKKVLFQAATCDQTIPNAFNYHLSSNIGSGGIGAAGALAGSSNSTFASAQAPSASCATGGYVHHGFITARGWSVTNYGTLAAGFSDFAATEYSFENLLANKAGATAAEFLKSGTIPGALITPASP